MRVLPGAVAVVAFVTGAGILLVGNGLAHEDYNSSWSNPGMHTLLFTGIACLVGAVAAAVLAAYWPRVIRWWRSVRRS